jgi:hypothetical protein
MPRRKYKYTVASALRRFSPSRGLIERALKLSKGRALEIQTDDPRILAGALGASLRYFGARSKLTVEGRIRGIYLVRK